MRKAAWLKYLILILLIVGSLVLDKYMYYKATDGFVITSCSYFAMPITTLLNIAIGVLIGLEHLFAEAKKAGYWKFNWQRALVLLLPALFLIIGFTGLYYGRILFRPILYLYKLKLLSSGMDILSISRLLFGYWLITSFYKNSKATTQITAENER